PTATLISLVLSPTPLFFFFPWPAAPPHPPSFPTRRSSDLQRRASSCCGACRSACTSRAIPRSSSAWSPRSAYRSRQRTPSAPYRSEEHTSELQSLTISYAVFCLKKKKHLSNATQL